MVLYHYVFKTSLKVYFWARINLPRLPGLNLVKQETFRFGKDSKDYI